MMAPAEALIVIEAQAEKRAQLKQEIEALSESRHRYIEERVDANGGAEDSLDEQIYRAVKNQAASVGLTYEDDRAKY